MNRMSAEASLNLYITAVHPCPYLPDRQAMNLLVDPCYKMTSELYGRLLDSGFRRSGGDVYRPHCRHCSACVSSRIAVNAFKPNRSQRRNWKRNQDLRVVVNRSGFKDEYAALYRDYIQQRHTGGGMDTDSMDTFAGFLLTRWCKTWLVEFWEQERLLAVAAVDELNNGLSSVYTFLILLSVRHAVWVHSRYCGKLSKRVNAVWRLCTPVIGSMNRPKCATKLTSNPLKAWSMARGFR